MPELVIQHDPVYWVLIDTLGDDPKAWADKMARERFPLEGREPTRKELKAMRAHLQTLVELQQAREIGTNLFARTPLASPPGLLVDVLVLAASDGSEIAMCGLTGADGTDLGEPADLS